MKFTQITLGLATLLLALTAQAQSKNLQIATYDVDLDTVNPAPIGNNVAAYDWEQMVLTIPNSTTYSPVYSSTTGTTTVNATTNRTQITQTVHPLLVQNTTDNTSFIAFCFDLLTGRHPNSTIANGGVGYTPYASPAAAGLTGTSFDTAFPKVQRLFDLYGPQVTQQLSSHVTTPSAVAGEYGEAMQLAIWNLVLDTDFSVSTGSFSVEPSKNGNFGIFRQAADVTSSVAKANTMLAGVQTDLADFPTKAPLYTTTLWLAPTTTASNGTTAYTSQMLIQSTAVVPEPSTYALLLAGLGVVGLSLRRRNAA